MAKNIKIGFLGASGLIAQELRGYAASQGHEVIGFGRAESPWLNIEPYSHLSYHPDLSALVNLVGGHSKNTSILNPGSISEIDVLASDWALSNSKPYIFISSGAIFGSRSEFPVFDGSPLATDEPLEPYVLSKLEAESRHETLRSQGGHVSDLRIFSYAGPHFLLGGNYFLSSVFRAAVNGKEFEVKGPGFIRDYIGARELWEAIEICLSLPAGVRANLFSAAPISRVQLMGLISNNFGLTFNYPTVTNAGDSGVEKYYSRHSDLLNSYRPRKSIEVVLESFIDAWAIALSPG